MVEGGLTHIQTSPMTFWLGDDQSLSGADNPRKIWSYCLKNGLLPHTNSQYGCCAYSTVCVWLATPLHTVSTGQFRLINTECIEIAILAMIPPLSMHNSDLLHQTPQDGCHRDGRDKVLRPWNPCARFTSPARHCGRLPLLVLQHALPPHSSALVLDLASALGLQQLAVV